MSPVTNMRPMIGVCLMSILAEAARGTERTEPTGASLAWTSEDPLVVRARELVQQGRLGDAIAALGQPADANDARAQMIELISRLRYQYAYSAADMLKRLEEPLPG